VIKKRNRGGSQQKSLTNNAGSDALSTSLPTNSKKPNLFLQQPPMMYKRQVNIAPTRPIQFTTSRWEPKRQRTQSIDDEEKPQHQQGVFRIGSLGNNNNNSS
jgi:hypothetical protein